MARNNMSMCKARTNPDDEFYTHLEDIENEVKHYKQFLEGAIITCPCGESWKTKFCEYLRDNRLEFKWKELRLIGYNTENPAQALIIKNDLENENLVEGDVESYTLRGNGDFRNDHTKVLIGGGTLEYEENGVPASIEVEKADIVIDNPPFSLFREFVKQCMDLGVELLIIGNKNAMKYKEIFPYFQSGEMCWGYTSPADFTQPEGHKKKAMAGLTRWFTTLPIRKRDFTLDTGITFKMGTNRGFYQEIDNVVDENGKKALCVNKTNQIPMDYEGVMGVPITYMDYHSPSQFKIVGVEPCPIVDGKKIYSRLLIQKIVK
jgi:hypothetical protein